MLVCSPAVAQVAIPALIDAEPRYVVWSAGDNALEKTVDINLSTKRTLSINDVVSLNSTFQCRLEVVVPNSKFRLHIKPTATTKAARSVIRILIAPAQNARQEVSRVPFGQVANKAKTVSKARAKSALPSINIHVEIK